MRWLKEYSAVLKANIPFLHVESDLALTQELPLPPPTYNNLVEKLNKADIPSAVHSSCE